MLSDNVMSLEFLQTFKEEYLRNNKSNGMKNVRCFPVCGPNHHREAGFCGQCIHVNVRMDPTLYGDFIGKKIVIVGEIQEVEHQGQRKEMRISGGITREDLYSQCYSVQSAPGKRFHVGCCQVREDVDDVDDGSKSMEFVFNNNPKGWQYDWESNRALANTQHAFVISVLRVSIEDTNYFEVIAQFQSPQFTVACKRRGYKNSTVHSETISTTETTSGPEFCKKKKKNTSFTKCTYHDTTYCNEDDEDYSDELAHSEVNPRADIGHDDKYKGRISKRSSHKRSYTEDDSSDDDSGVASGAICDRSRADVRSTSDILTEKKHKGHATHDLLHNSGISDSNTVDATKTTRAKAAPNPKFKTKSSSSYEYSCTSNYNHLTSSVQKIYDISKNTYTCTSITESFESPALIRHLSSSRRTLICENATNTDCSSNNTSITVKISSIIDSSDNKISIHDSASESCSSVQKIRDHCTSLNDYQLLKEAALFFELQSPLFN